MVETLGSASVDIRADFSRLQRQLNSTNRIIEGGLARSLGGLKLALAAIGGFAIAGALGGIVGTVRDFESSLSGLKAVSGATAKEMEALERQARELGSTTAFSAVEAANAQEFLAKAGFSVQKILDALPSTLDLAAAGQLDLASAADVASNVLSAFQLEAREMARVSDVLAKSANSSNTSVGQLAEALKFAAPVARAFGQTVEATTAAIGILSNNGLQASIAGTGLRKVIVTLAAPTDDLRKLMGNLSIETDGLVAVLGQLQQSGISAAQAMEFFGDRGGPAFNILIGSIAGLENLSTALEDSVGEAARVATERMDNLAGAGLRLSSAMSELNLIVGESGLKKSLRDLTEGLAEIAQSEGAADAARNIGRGLSFLIDNAQGIATATAGLATFVGVMKTLSLIPVGGPIPLLIKLVTALGIAAVTARNAFAGLEGINLEAALPDERVVASLRLTQSGIATIEKQLKRTFQQVQAIQAGFFTAGAGETITTLAGLRGDLARMTEQLKSLRESEQELIATSKELEAVSLAEAEAFKEAGIQAEERAKSVIKAIEAEQAIASAAAARLAADQADASAVFLSALEAENAILQARANGQEELAETLRQGIIARQIESRLSEELSRKLLPGEITAIEDLIKRRNELTETIVENTERERESQKKQQEDLAEAQRMLDDSQRQVVANAREVGRAFASNLDDALSRTESLSGALRNLALDLVNVARQQLLIKPFGEFVSGQAEKGGEFLKGILKSVASSVIGGGGGGNISLPGGFRTGSQFSRGFAGGLQDGGRILSNQFAVIGERGPELFAPGVSGTVIPNGALGGGPNITQNISIQTGVAQTVRTEMLSILPQFIERTRSALIDDVQRGGAFAAAVRGR